MKLRAINVQNAARGGDNRGVERRRGEILFARAQYLASLGGERSDVNEGLYIRIPGGRGRDYCAAIGMAHDNDRPVLGIDHPLGCGDIIWQ